MLSLPLTTPEQVPMRAPTENDPKVTCSSCQFIFPKVRGFCPLCGTPVDEAACCPRNSAPTRPQISLKMILAVMALLICASLWTVRHQRSSLPISPAIKSSMPGSGEITVAPRSSPQPLPAFQEHISSESITDRARIVEIRDDPAQLWKSVQRGNANAEVQLAKLYLAGNGVAKNCEQAHLLLLAASKKRSNAASNLLAGDYVRRCQQ